MPVLTSHPAALWPGDHPDRAFTGLTARTPASLKGQLTRRIYAYLVSSWLTNAIDRIVKELPLNQTGGSARNALLYPLRSTPSGIASPHPPTPSAGAKVHLSSSPRPSDGFVMWQSELHSNTVGRQVKPLVIFFVENGVETYVFSCNEYLLIPMR